MKKFILLLIIASLLLINLSSAIVWDNAAYWTFNETSGLAVDIAYGTNNGTLSNQILRGVPGILNNSYKFNNTGSVLVANSRSVNFTQNMSFSFWINSTNFNGDSFIFSKINGTTGWDFMANDSGFLNRYMLRLRNISGDGTFIRLVGGGLNSSLWTHVVVTSNSSSLTLYQNGLFANTTLWSGSFLTNTLPLNITYATSSSNGTILDEIGFWNRTISPSEIQELYNSGKALQFRTFLFSVNLNSPSDNSTIVSSNVVFNATIPVSSGAFNLTNATLYLYNSTAIFNQTTNFLANNVSNSSLWNITLGRIDDYKWNVLGCQTDGIIHNCTFAPNNFTFSFGVLVNSNTYNLTTSESFTESFVTNITIPSSESVSSANLIWNGTLYSGNIDGTGTNYILSRTITIPSGTGNKTWYWSINFASGSQQNTSNLIQTVNSLSVDNCSSNTMQIFNFTLYDEDSRNNLTGTIELIINFFNTQRTASAGSFNASYAVNATTSAKVCVAQTNSTYNLDYQAKYYSNSSYVVEYKFAQALTFNNNTGIQSVKLYDLLDSRSTSFTITLQNPDLSKINGAVIDIQRQYVPINQFISIESPLTKNDGSSVGHLVAKEIYYNFIVNQNGTLLGTFNNQLVQCQNEVTGDCRINLNLIQATASFPDFNNYGNISTNFLWSSSTRTLYFTFVSTDSLTHIVAWNVSRMDNYGNNTICTNSLLGTTGAFTCVIPALYGNSSIVADIFSDGSFLGESGFSLQPSSQDIFGGTKVILGLLMYSTLTLLLIGHPIMIIVGAVLGMGFAVGFHVIDGGTFFGNSSIFLWFVIAGAIVIFYFRNKT